MKLRTRSFEESFGTPNSASTPKKIKVQKPDDFEIVHPDAVTSYGEFGKCEGTGCDGVPAETIKINDERLCRTCAIKSDGNLDFKGKTFDKSDAEFKCPAFSSEGSCKSERISFDEFYLGSCCEQASKWLTENEKARKKKLHVMKNLHAEAKREQKKADEESKETKKTIDEKEKLLVRGRKRIEEILKIIQDTEKELKEKKEAQGATEKTLEEKNKKMDIVSKRYKQLSYEYHASVTRKEEQKDDNDNSAKANCRVCLEKYGDEWKTAKWILKKCGHAACGNCLDRILADAVHGSCPHCRTSFSMQDMIRIHD